MSAVVAEHLAKRGGELTAVADLSFEASSGQRVAVPGAR